MNPVTHHSSALPLLVGAEFDLDAIADATEEAVLELEETIDLLKLALRRIASSFPEEREDAIEEIRLLLGGD